MATYVIGDVQGCYDELIALLAKINYQSTQDVLWFTGDLVNRGPKSLKTLRFIHKLPPSTVVVLGNHDLHLLAAAAGVTTLRDKDTLGKILEAEDCYELLQWLRTRPLLHFDEQQKCVMTHAGILPAWSLQEAITRAREVEALLAGEDYLKLLKNMYGSEPACWDAHLSDFARWRFIINSFTRMRYCTTAGCLDLTFKGTPGSESPGLIPWFRLPNRVVILETLLFGHWAALNGQTGDEHLQALDTGCVWGNTLTALRLEDRQRFSVAAKRA